MKAAEFISAIDTLNSRSYLYLGRVVAALTLHHSGLLPLLQLRKKRASGVFQVVGFR